MFLAWNRNSFELQHPYEQPPSPAAATSTAYKFVPIGDHGAVKNFDLHEARFVIAKDSPSPTVQSMAIDDRRHFAVVHLRHKGPGNKSLMVVITHLMTDSRDNERTNVFPGEVRARELASIREYVQAERQRQACDAVIFTGDFNISLSAHKPDDELHVFLGKLQSGDEKCEVPSGFNEEFRVLDWPRESPMRDAFEDIHKWGEGVGHGGTCSSFSSKRCNWIDFMFYTAETLQLKKTSENRTPPNPIPAQGYPSDHLPICALFEFRSH